MDLIFKFIIGLFTGKAGEAVGGAVSGVAQIAALMAAVAPVWYWLSSNKDAVFIQLTYGDLAFWGSLIGVIVFLTVRLVHYARPPNQ